MRKVNVDNVFCSQCRHCFEHTGKMWPDCHDCETIKYLVESIQAYLRAEDDVDMQIAIRMANDSIEQAAFGMLD